MAKKSVQYEGNPGFATAAQVIGIISIVVSLLNQWVGAVFAIVAIVLGATSLKTEKKGRASAGLATGIVALFICLLFILIPVAYQGVSNKAVTASGDALTTELQAQALRLHGQMPQKSSPTATTTDVTASGHVITYHVDLTSDVDESQLSDKSLKDPMVGTLCTNTDSRSLLDDGVTFEYDYTHSGSGNIYKVSITKYDC